MKWNRVVFLSFASLLTNQLHQNVQFTAQLQYSWKWIERIAVHTTESNKTCANKRQHAFATALTVVDIGHKVYISIAIRNNLHVKRTETERTREMNQERKKERKKPPRVRKREKNWRKKHPDVRLKIVFFFTFEFCCFIFRSCVFTRGPVFVMAANVCAPSKYGFGVCTLNRMF